MLPSERCHRLRMAAPCLGACLRVRRKPRYSVEDENDKTDRAL
ncbi:hypothetical protein EDWATA_00656 [Edwardsiella tarda ATCC 23685]|uniref:Uncharacterized protein n=1 Tax=Edwardsiella tarda ATCC 23685 TaxID=500638 RepID=D4F1R3_EDWTA|nr:hypothetical protein EDWATA_00656 [Edwardsiella tarda ATCC 23685]